MNIKDKIARRSFLRDSLSSAAIGVVGIRFAIRDVVAQAKRVNKPILTERNFNALIPGDQNSLRPLAVEAKRDLRAYIRKRFYLTSSQQHALDELSERDIEKVKEAIDMALDKRKRIRVKFNQSDPRPVPVSYAPLPRVQIWIDGGFEPGWVIIGVKGDDPCK